MKIGLLFGSFNPIHTGHLLIANYMVEYTELDKIWFVVSPQNPFKVNDELLDENLRLKMIEMAIADDNRFEACNIEFGMPKPNYTHLTLTTLTEKYPEHQFTPIIGGDNLQSFHLWKNYESILENYQLFVYRRAGFHENPLLANHKKISLYEVPLLNISSTYIRETLQAGKSIRYLVPKVVKEFIVQHHLYQ
ncbi:MAG: nicotinate-nucleotide adenylyltransferase [Bacteroidia bacterium]|nr:nicotinate-nucleotide adenylyltransferase [Bacteroidia bacterium]